jgi:hypothetical protein
MLWVGLVVWARPEEQCEVSLPRSRSSVRPREGAAEPLCPNDSTPPDAPISAAFPNPPPLPMTALTPPRGKKPLSGRLPLSGTHAPIALFSSLTSLLLLGGCTEKTTVAMTVMRDRAESRPLTPSKVSQPNRSKNLPGDLFSLYRWCALFVWKR